MTAETQAATLWARVTRDVRKALAGFTDRKRVINRDGDKLVVVSHDPRATASKTISKLRGVPVDPSDDVLTIQLGGREVAIGALLKPGEVDQASYITGFGSDGTASTASRSDHSHQSGSSEGMKIGANASQTLRGQAIGRNASAADASVSVGQNVHASGYVSVAIGWDAGSAGEHSVSIGYASDSGGYQSVAVGYGSQAPHPYGVAIGSSAAEAREQAVAIGASIWAQYYGVAIGHDSTADVGGIAIGRSSFARGQWSVAIGHGADANGTRSIVLGSGSAHGQNDTAVIYANTIFMEPSSGSAATTLRFRRSDGNVHSVNFNNWGDMLVNGTPIVYRGWHPNNVWGVNKSIASGGPWTFRSAPVVSSANQIIALYSASVYDTGTRLGAGGYTWANIFVHGYGWGWIVQEALV